MIRSNFIYGFAIAVAIFSNSSLEECIFGAETTPQKPPRQESGYSFIRDAIDGKKISVQANEDDSRLIVVCFLGSECPLAKLYGPRLSHMAAEFAASRVRFVGVNSNQQDSTEDILKYVREHQISFPIIRDAGNVIADLYQATRTPEVFVLDRSLQLQYRGRIDDQYEPGISRTTPNRNDLRSAIEDLLADRPVSVTQTEAIGCLIGKVHRSSMTSQSTVTYCKEVRRVLQKHCLECHRSGEIGPFSMENYDEVVGWAGTMLEAIDSQRMPPWHADPNFGRFANSRHMPDEDKQTLREWIATGMPKGEIADLPEPVSFVDGWQLQREPDLVLPMRDRPFQVPAAGTVEYQYFVIDPHFTEDKWVTGAQIIPGSRQVVHHAIVFVRPPDGTAFRGIGWLTAYVPGQRLVALPPGYGRKVPAGSKLVFQMHYTTNGTTQQDLSRVGIVFGNPGEMTHEVLTSIGIDQEFEIPPHAKNHEVKGEVRWLPKNGTLLAISPHMHYRGKSFRLFADRDEQTLTLLHVPEYRFNWQHTYELSEPLPLTGIDRLRFTTTFDNSKSNPFNPDATQWVNWGDQSWEEMAVVFLAVAEPLQKTTHDVKPVPPSKAAEREKKVQQFVDEFFAKLDVNRDGLVHQSEVPLAIRRISFWRFDHNHDQQVTRDEIRRTAEEIP